MLRDGEVSGAELFAAYRAAIDAHNDELNAYLTVADDPGGDGVPIALKDVISTTGIRTTAGSRILENYVPVFDATVAANCKRHGLRTLGKTNTDEFAMGSSSENSAYGPSRNPWDPSRVPGGSGGGSAAAVAAGLAPWALGSDTGGSIKLPSAFCGNVGLRPTYGTVSRYGVVAFASSLDQVGPVTKTVRDCAYLYRIISGRDENDSTTVDVPPVEIPESDDLRGLRIGLPRQLNDVDGIEPGVRAAVDAALAHAENLGASIETCELPLSVDYGLACYYLIAPAEASANLARYDGVRYGLRVDGDTFTEMVMATRHDGFGDEVKRRIMLGTYALSAGYYDAYYGTAQKVRTVIKREHDALFERFDVLVSPTCATTAFAIGAKSADPLAMYLTDVLTIPPNMAGLPSMSIPCGLSDGLPVGLQLIGPQFAENTLFRAGHALEQAIAFDYVPERMR
ncbi:MAG: Asp-tRNA(Asn)/Glu-tRNA(Gln) amidotransferase subunit GatA [Actinobacteria bacterium]|nr:Asp-tRNA(Asn)/Glu-tRNA(Gln) amidotransferase subunit GatA [Actinomycetota bacterium]